VVLYSFLSVSQAYQELSNALEKGFLLYVKKPWKHVILDNVKLRSEISKIKNVVVIPPVSVGKIQNITFIKVHGNGCIL